MQYLEQRENLHDDSPSLSYTQPANNNNTVKHVLSGHSKIVSFIALRPKSTSMVMAGRSVHLTTLFPGQA